MRRLTCYFSIVVSALLIGCGQNQTSESHTKSAQKSTQRKTTGRRTPADAAQKELANRAKDELFARLSGRLISVISEEGPAKAISVCSVEAPEIARNVGDELGVSIGRTSFQLRNPKNKPPEWSASFVKARIDKPQYVELPNGKLGALLPIVLQPKCVTCHGPQDTLAEDVRTALAERYPNDQATGFQAGDLRGWFWVEVPNLSKTK